MKQDRKKNGLRHHSSQRGALMFITPMLLLLIVLFGALMLDGARLYAMREAMQSQVNAAATAAASAAQGCGGASVTLASIRQRALVAARAQGFSEPDTALQVQPGVIVAGGDKVLSFQPVSDLSRSNGVAVTYQKEVPVSGLLPGLLGTITLSAKAAARKELIATLSAAGSTAVLGGTQQTANVLNVLLGAILNNGTPFSIDPTNYASLAKTTARLGTVLDTLGVDSLGELLSTDVLAGDLLAALQGALGSRENSEDTLYEAGEALDQLIGAAGVDTVKLSDVIDIVGTTRIPENSRLPVYDTVIALVLNLVQGAVIEGALPKTSINIPNVASIKLDLFVGKAPTVVVGPARTDASGQWITHFQAADISLQLVSKLNVLGLIKVQLPLAVRAGGGTGALVWASCAAGRDNSVTVGVDVQGQTARIATGHIDADGDLIPSEISLSVLDNGLPGGISLAEITANLDVTLGGGSEQVQLSYALANGKPSAVYTEGGLSDADFDSLELTVDLLATDEECNNLLGCLLDGLGDVLSGLVEGITDLIGLEDLIKETVSGLIKSLGTTLIDPLLNGLGVSLGTTKIEITGASQSHVQLLQYCGPHGC